MIVRLRLDFSAPFATLTAVEMMGIRLDLPK